MRISLMLLVLVLLAIPAWGLWRVRHLGQPRWWNHVGRAYGWCLLATLPAALLQPLYWALGQSRWSGEGLLTGLAMLPGGWMVLLGGRSVITVFEANVKEWTGHRRDTMFDNLPVYLALTAAKLVVLIAILSWRSHRGGGLRDPWVVAIGLFLLADALLAINWMWFGT